MSLGDLSPGERNIVLECLRAAVEGPFFPDWEFQTLFGLERKEVKEIADAWPALNERDRKIAMAINGSFNNLLGYPHRCEKEWPRFISVSREEAENIYSKWRSRYSQSYLAGFMD
jgi:hypothetical protein